MVDTTMASPVLEKGWLKFSEIQTWHQERRKHRDTPAERDPHGEANHAPDRVGQHQDVEKGGDGTWFGVEPCEKVHPDGEHYRRQHS